MKLEDAIQIAQSIETRNCKYILDQSTEATSATATGTVNHTRSTIIAGPGRTGRTDQGQLKQQATVVGVKFILLVNVHFMRNSLRGM